MVSHGDVFKIGAVAERAVADGSDTVRYGGLRQPGAAMESVIVNPFDIFADGNIGQARTAAESGIADGQHAVGNNDTTQGGIVPESAAADSRYRAARQRARYNDIGSGACISRDGRLPVRNRKGKIDAHGFVAVPGIGKTGRPVEVIDFESVRAVIENVRSCRYGSVAHEICAFERSAGTESAVVDFGHAGTDDEGFQFRAHGKSVDADTVNAVFDLHRFQV